MKKIRQIFLVLDTARSPNQDYVRGLTRYSHVYGPWIFHGMPAFYRTGKSSSQSARESLLSDEDFLSADAVFGYLGISLAAKIRKLGKPAVNLQLMDIKKVPDLINVIDEPDTTGVMGAEHLLGLGIKHFAFCGWENFHWSRLRRRGFEKRISEAGFKASIYQEPEESKNQTLEEQRELLADWLVSLPKPVGVMACNDDRSREIADACLIANLNIPDEVAVLGVDNDEMVCNLSLPPLSSIALNHEMIGYEAGQLLDEMMAGKTVEEQTLFIKPVQIFSRQSTDILAIEDMEVAKAVRFIRDNSKLQLSVEDVADETTVSLRTLQTRFRKIVGRSIHEEMRRVRMEIFCKMLLETTMSVQQIALALDYNDLDHVARAFKKETGITPLKYRKKYGHL